MSRLKQTSIMLLTGILLGLTITASASDDTRETRQAELDAACEAARNEQLIPLREEMVKTCVEKQEFDSQSECESYYSDYGERAGGRQPMFYDLPACVEAFEYAQSERSGG